MTDLVLTHPHETASGAALSEDGLYRYRLWRAWGPGERLVWVMLNPSTAGVYLNDPTIVRCIRFAARDGFDGIEVINLYALRATKPIHLADHPDPEGPDNSQHWQEVLDGRTGLVVAAWGAGDARLHLPHSQALRRWFGSPAWHSLGVTKAGYPRHPLYVRADTPFRPLNRAAS